MITFVIFHVDVLLKDIDRFKILPKFHHKSLKYNRLLDLAFRSALLFHPQCRLVLLTDHRTEVRLSSQVMEKIEICRSDVDCSQIMFSRTQVERAYLEQHDFKSNVIFMDSDMLVANNLEDIFAQKFDVALTYNEGLTETDKNMPINGGLVFINRRDKAHAISFFDRVHHHYCGEKLEKYKLWWGDQYALIEAVGREKFFSRKEDLILSDEVIVQFLPCETYNFTPVKKAKAITKSLTQKKIIHFRGARKKYMCLYWDKYLALQETSGVKLKVQVVVANISLLCRRIVFK